MYLKTQSVERWASTVRVPIESQVCHVGRWDTIRYALDSNARTFRLCLIWAVVIISPIVAAAVAVVIRHAALDQCWRPTEGSVQLAGANGLAGQDHCSRVCPKGRRRSALDCDLER